MDKLNLEINWEVNNASLQSGMNESKKTIEGVGQTAQKVEDRVQAGLDEIVVSNKNVEKSYKDVEKAASNIAKPIVIETAKAKSSFNGLQNSINQISRELPAFTYSAQTGFMAISNNIPMLFDELSKLRKENDLLTASGQKGVPVWKQLIGSLFSWGTALSVGVTLLTVYGKEIGEWIKGLFKGKNALDELKKAQEEFNATRLKGTQNAQAEITKLQSLYKVTQDSTMSLKDRNKAVDALQKQYPAYFSNLTNEAILAGKARGAYDQLTQSIIAAAQARAYENKITEISSKILENNDKATAKAVAITADESGRAHEKAIINSGGMMMFAPAGERTKEAVKEIRELNDQNAVLSKEMDRYKNAIYNLVSKNGVEVLTGEVGKIGSTGVGKKTLDQYENLLSEITDLDKEYARQKVDEDSVEMMLLEEKFEKIRKKIIDFNNDKDNKFKINISDLDPIEANAKNNLHYTQNTNKLQKQYEEEYKVFQQYEELKKSTNELYANERYATQLDSIKSFEQRLNDELSKIDPNTTNELERKRLEGLNKVKTELFNKQQAEEDKRLMESLELVKSFNDKRIEIEKKYQDARKALGDKITLEQDQELKRKESKDVSKLATEELQQSESWNLLFSDLDRLTVAQIDKLIQEIESHFDNLSINFDPVDLDAIRKKLQEAKDEVIEKNPFKAVGDSLKSIFKGASDESGQSSENIKDQWVKLAKATNKSFDFVADAVNSAEFLKDALGDTGAAAISALQGVSLTAVAVSTAIKNAEKASAILAIIQAALVVVQAVFSFLDGAAKKRNEQLQKEQEYYDTLSETFDILIDKQKKLFAEQSGKSAMEAYKDALDMVNSKLVANRKGLEAWFAQGASWRSHSNWYKYDEELGNVLSRQKLLNMTGKEWEELLRNQPEIWARLPSEVREYAQSVIDAKEQTNELREAMQEAFAGFSFEDLKNELHNLFTQADLTMENIGESFYKHMQKAILQTIQDKSMTAGMEKWYKNLVENLEDGELSSSEADRLKAEYQSLVEKGRKEYEAAMKAIGYDSSSSSNSSLKAEGIERLTEQTGTEFIGLQRASLDISKQHLVISQRALSVWQESHNALVQILRHEAAIEANTAETVNQLKLVVEGIRNTNKNLGGKYGV